jgi:2-dehydropantoate 2-reductase
VGLTYLSRRDIVHIVVLGAGALGSILGGYIAETGEDVTLVGRKAHVEAIRTDGLVIEGMRGRHVVRNIRAVTELRDVGSADVLILAVKSYDTGAALASMAHLRSKVGAVLSVQNGGGKDEALADALGQEAVVGATSIVGGAMPEPGRVTHTNEGGTWIGEFDGRRSARVEAIARLFHRAELKIEVRDDIRSAIWCKLNQMVPAAALACVTRLHVHEMYQDPSLAALFVELTHEVAAVADRLKIPLVDCQGFPVKTLCAQPFEAAVESIIARGRIMEERGMTQVKISTLQDLERGKRTEAEHVIGYVVGLAAAHGVAIPKLDLLYRVIRGAEAAQRPMTNSQ